MFYSTKGSAFLQRFCSVFAAFLQYFVCGNFFSGWGTKSVSLFFFFLLYNYFIEFTEVYLLLAVPLFLPKKIIILLSYFTVNCGLTLLLIKSEECTVLFLDTGK